MAMVKDKQLSNIKLAEVRQKQQFDQALNAKEFAVLAGISYATARQWFHRQGFPALQGLVFWQDFVTWRQRQHGLASEPAPAPKTKTISLESLPEKARRLLQQV